MGKCGIKPCRGNKLLFLPEVALILSLLAFVPKTTISLIGLFGVERYFPGYSSELMTSNALGRYLYHFYSWTAGHVIAYCSIGFAIVSLGIIVYDQSKEVNKKIFKTIALSISIFSIIASLVSILFMQLSMGV